MAREPPFFVRRVEPDLPEAAGLYRHRTSRPRQDHHGSCSGGPATAHDAELLAGRPHVPILRGLRSGVWPSDARAAHRSDRADGGVSTSILGASRYARAVARYQPPASTFSPPWRMGRTNEAIVLAAEALHGDYQWPGCSCPWRAVFERRRKRALTSSGPAAEFL